MSATLEMAPSAKAGRARNSGRPPTASRLAVAALFLMNGTIFGTWVSRIPAIQAERGLSHGALGFALLGLALGALVSMPMAGRLSARLGSDRVCRQQSLIYCLSLPLLALAPGFVGLALLLFGFGLSHGALDIAMNAQAVAVEKRYARPIMSSFHALFSLGGLLGSAMGGLIAWAGIAPFWHFVGMSLLLAALTLRIGLPHLISDREVAPPARKVAVSLAPPVRRSRALITIGIVAFCVMMGEGAMADWTGVYLRKELHSSEALAAAAYAAFSITMATARFVGDGLIVRVGAVGLARLGGLFAAGGMALALLSASPLLAMLGFACVGLGFATIVPMAFSAAGQTPGVSAGVALATASTIGYFGFLIGPPLIGLAAELLGLRGALAIILVSSLLIILLAPAVRVRAPAPR